MKSGRALTDVLFADLRMTKSKMMRAGRRKGRREFMGEAYAQEVAGGEKAIKGLSPIVKIIQMSDNRFMQNGLVKNASQE
jgi:hypothetical protein